LNSSVQIKKIYSRGGCRTLPTGGYEM